MKLRRLHRSLGSWLMEFPFPFRFHSTQHFPVLHLDPLAPLSTAFCCDSRPFLSVFTSKTCLKCSCHSTNWTFICCPSHHFSFLISLLFFVISTETPWPERVKDFVSIRFLVAKNKFPEPAMRQRLLCFLFYFFVAPPNASFFVFSGAWQRSAYS